ncbi:DoxX family protein [Rhodoflexus caldus]|uniref:DoxX family protein n=1 Tax=Rhodoflexus caldus TaxID=2891236 RepID=UPI00202A9B22|nr:DoxX family protein [Rhodoflexus caldus]
MRQFFAVIDYNGTPAHIALLVLRVGFGLLMLPHGLAKWQRLSAGETSFADPIGIGEYPSLLLAVFAEVICSVLLTLGLLHRLALLPLIILTAVAAFIVHAQDALDVKEHALLYLFAYLPMWWLGAGKYSLDALLFGLRKM